MVACENGMTLTDVQSVNMTFPQWNDGQDLSGIAIDASGASSERLIIATLDSRPLATESFINIAANYGGDVSINGGVHSTSSGGVFFDPAGRDGDDPDVDVQNVKNVTNSKAFANGHFDSNTTDTVISAVDTPVKLNAGVGGWNDVGHSRFNFDTVGTWTYTGKETITKFAILAATLDPFGGGTKDVSIYIAKNGTAIPASRGETSASAGSQVVAFTNITLETGDYLECFIENNTDDADILVRNATFDDT